MIIFLFQAWLETKNIRKMETKVLGKRGIGQHQRTPL